MSTKTTYAGVQTTLHDSLFNPPTINKIKPRKSYKFDTVSYYYDGVYYFLSDLIKSTKREGKPYEIQGVYYDGKWRQDSFYITEELKNILTP